MRANSARFVYMHAHRCPHDPDWVPLPMISQHYSSLISVGVDMHVPYTWSWYTNWGEPVWAPLIQLLWYLLGEWEWANHITTGTHAMFSYNASYIINACGQVCMHKLQHSNETTGNFGGSFNLAIWRLKSRSSNILSCMHEFICSAYCKHSWLYNVCNCENMMALDPHLINIHVIPIRHVMPM